MSRKKDDDESDKNRDKDENEERPPQREYETDPVEVHRDYIERQLGGGAPATPEAYARAINQWHALPGAVRVPPTELTGDEAAPPSDEEQEENSREEPRS